MEKISWADRVINEEESNINLSRSTRDFRLSPRNRRELHSSGLLRLRNNPEECSSHAT